jgi:tRNA pseudouridine55 synthase
VTAGAGESAPSGVLVVDKPVGPSSHHAVARVRRALGMQRVGHAGTLDPLASGVLVVLVGEGTKLGAYLTAHRKRYVARVVLGVETSTLDAEGEVTREGEVPGWLLGEIEELAGGGREAPRIEGALAGERARTEQVPPAFSAIQVGWLRSYARARAGEEVELEERAVEVMALSVTGAGVAPRPFLELEMEVGKGYYVRSLARDLGERLGLPAHLGALRRTASGPFEIAGAVPLDAGAARLREAIVPLGEVVGRSLPVVKLTGGGGERAKVGKRLGVGDFEDAPPEGVACAWVGEEGRLVAIGVWRDGEGAVSRGFAG